MTLQDAKSIFDAYASDPEAARFMTFTTQTDVSETLDYLLSQQSAFEQGTSILWAITLKNDDAFAGAIEIRIDGDDGEIGFIIGKPYWGRGIVPEALRAVLTFASDTLKLSEVRGRCDIDNTRSARVFEKTGFRSLGIVENSVLHPNISKAPRDGRAFVYDVSGLRTTAPGT